MRLSTHHEVAAPIDAVFRSLTDLERAKRAALRRGWTLQRLNDGAPDLPGAQWLLALDWRERPREVWIKLDRYARPDLVAFAAQSRRLDLHLRFDLSALAADRTRVAATLDIRGRGAVGKVIVAALRPWRRRLEQRFTARLSRILSRLDLPAAPGSD